MKTPQPFAFGTGWSERRPPGVIGTIDVGAKREQHAGGRRIAMHGGHMQRRVPRQVERVDRRAVFA